MIRAAVYREAGTVDLIRAILGYLWEWIYRAGISFDEVEGWFSSLVSRFTGNRGAVKIPDSFPTLPRSMVDAAFELLSDTGMTPGELMQMFTRELAKPPSGFAWVLRDGRQVLVKSAAKKDSPTRGKPIVWGKKYRDKVFLSVWWTSALPRGPRNQALQRFVTVYWRTSRLIKPSLPGPDVQKTRINQYGGFLIVPEAEAPGIASELCGLVQDAVAEGDGEYKAGAFRLVAFSENRPVEDSDQVRYACATSKKLTNRITIRKLLNGAVEDFQGSKVYQNLIQMLRTSP